VIFEILWWPVLRKDINPMTHNLFPGRRARLWTTFALLVAALVVGLVAWTPAGSGGPEAAVPPDVALVPSDAALVMGVRVADLWTSDLARPARQKLAREAAEVAGELEKALACPPEQIDRLTLMVLSFGPGTEVFVVHTKKPYDRARVLKRAGDKAKEETYKGRTLHVGPGGDAVCLLDERTYVVAKADPLRGLLDRPAKEKDGPLTPARQQLGGKHDFVFGLNLPAFMEQVGADLPGEVEPYKPLFLAKTAVLTARAGQESRADLLMTFADTIAAKQAGKAAEEGLKLARGAITAGRITQAKERALLQLLDVAEAVVKGTKTEVDGTTLKVTARAAIDPLPAATALAEAINKPNTSAARVQSQNNLKQIALAMHNFHSVYGHFPAAAIYDRSGKPLLSWRVQLLPFLEQQRLYEKFHLDEPWDSEHNKKLLEGMPKVFQIPSEKPRNLTHYLGFVGKGTVFEGKKGITLADITDGTSNTLMVVEAANAVPWTKPEDLPYDPSAPLPKLGGLFEGGFNVAMCDGSVRFLSTKVKPQTLHLMIQRNDGQPLGSDF
jgi:prepilin-type processing-associated H-X9-DG protein